MTARFDAVFFDLGGTLFSYRLFRRPLVELVLEAGRRLGVAEDPAVLRRAYTLASVEAARSMTPRPFYLHRDLFLETFRGFAQAVGAAPPDDALIAWFLEAQRAVMLKHLELREDCHATLEKLRQDGLTLAIVSNIDDDYLEPMVTQTGLDMLVHHWTSSETARSCKPDARFFELCLERAGHAPERVLFVGDSPVHDIAGARRLGMHTALIEEEGAAPPGQEGGAAAEPHFRIRALAELLHIVARS